MAVQVDSFHFPESWLEVRDLAINASLPSDRQAIDPRFPAPEVYARPPSRAVPATAAWPRSLARSEQTATTAWSLQPPSEQQRRSQKSSDASWEVSMPSSSPASPKSRKEFGQKKGGWSLFHAAQMRRTKFARWPRQMRPTPAPVPGCRERQRLRQQ